MDSAVKEKLSVDVDVYPLTFEPELVWGKCFEKEVNDMKMKAVWFEGDCVKCAMCVEEASAAFDFEEDTGPVVKNGVDFTSCSDGIKQAANVCPTQRIKYHLLPPAATGG